MKKITVVTVLMMFMTLTMKAQTANLKNNTPLFYLDSISVQYNEVKELSPEQIASVSVLKDQQAVALFGEKAKYGVVFLESKNYSRKKYWNLFSSFSKDYKAAFPSPPVDGEVVYVVKGLGMNENPGDLLPGLDSSDIKKVSMIPARTLKKKFAVEGKKGVRIDIRRKAIKKEG